MHFNMTPLGEPMHKGQAMFPTKAPEGLVNILKQQRMKNNEAVNIVLTLSPQPKNHAVSEDDLISSAKLEIKNGGYPYHDLSLMTARPGPKGRYFTLTVPAEFAQVNKPPSRCSHLWPQPLRY